jgi:hypothetical protein
VKQTQSLPRLMLAGLILVVIVLLGAAFTPLEVLADGTGDPPMGSPINLDSIPGETCPPADPPDSTVDGLLYELITLVALA